ncbi:hypothetical protein CYMTET_40562 [Cymbomonas tetramitiformis]|uniref:Uncharacterized protein n=1 Tax=Cymbomonas tetramitiformis TaxID=36881 RepID=A0AAE0CA38_9CHLO|nr:hypothetical protein CYMTET_40562 [Cymbomonas tetramitiformis]
MDVLFDFDDPTLIVHENITKLVYDTLACIVEPDSSGDDFLLGTGAVSDRDVRRALIDLIKGFVLHAIRQKLYSTLRYQARVNPRVPSWRRSSGSFTRIGLRTAEPSSPLPPDIIYLHSKHHHPS